VQACGDAHISNFGGFAAQDRRLVFGPNDFDETLPGPWEWDVSGWRPAPRSLVATLGSRRSPAADRDRLRAGVSRGDARLREREPSRRVVRPLNASELVDRFGGKLGKKGRILFAKPFAKARRQDEPAGG